MKLKQMIERGLSWITFALVCFCSAPVNAWAANLGEYVILRDIGQYRIADPEALITGHDANNVPLEQDGPGSLAAADHFPDHVDRTYTLTYRGGPGAPQPVARITLHAGGESDAWLQHEAEYVLRDADDDEGGLGMPHRDAKLMSVHGNRIFNILGVFLWPSKDVIVELEGDYVTTGPIEVVEAYLKRFPSTIPPDLLLDEAHDVQWIKDEMSRRLWLGNRWLVRMHAGKTQSKTALAETGKSMGLFIDYRAKYYGVRPQDEKSRLADILERSDENGMIAKVREYEQWWQAHQNAPMMK